MKYAREIKIGLLALVCLFLLFFGFNFLKGMNIFSSFYHFQGVFTEANGLQEQAAVYVKGYQVGQVDRIRYDFSKDSAFVVEISIDSDIRLPHGTQMVLIQDGLLGGGAIELRIPTGETDAYFASGDVLPTQIEPGLMAKVEEQLLAQVGRVVENVDSLVTDIHAQMDGDHIQSALRNVDQVSADLKNMSGEMPEIVGGVKRSVGTLEQSMARVDDVVAGANRSIKDVNRFTGELAQVDILGTVAGVNAAVEKVDGAVEQVSGLVTDMRSSDGTIGRLLYSPTLYNNLDSTVVSADSLLRDLKQNPKRYVHFSLIDCSGRKKK